MIVTTTTAIGGRPVTEYVGVVTGEAVLGANVFRDLFASLRDIVDGRSAGYERSLRQARDTVLGEDCRGRAGGGRCDDRGGSPLRVHPGGSER
jgi:uncharacterized protein YbjQ (UPF0145 family)